MTERKLIISVKSRFPSLMEAFISGFDLSIKEQVKKDKESRKVKIEKERYKKEYVVTMIGDEKIIKKFYDKNIQEMKKTKLRYKALMKGVGIKVKITME